MCAKFNRPREREGERERGEREGNGDTDIILSCSIAFEVVKLKIEKLITTVKVIKQKS